MPRNFVQLKLRSVIGLLVGIFFVMLLYNTSYMEVLYKMCSGVWYAPSSKFHEFDNNTDELSLKYLLATSIDVAERGGTELVTLRNLVDLQAVKEGKIEGTRGDSDPLSEGIARSYCAMMHGLKKIHPKIKVMLEKEDCTTITLYGNQRRENTEVTKILESEDEKVLSEHIAIWVEPLDCFHEYKKSILHCVATMVCVAVNGKPVIGVIHHPFQNLTVWGWVGHGVTSKMKIGKTFFKEWTTEPEIVLSRTEARLGAEFAARAFGGDETITLAGGAGFKLLQVFQGLVSVYLHLLSIKKWDICAGDALLQTVGGNVTTLKGTLISYEAHDEVDIKGGLLATLFKHDFFLEKFKKAKI